MYKFIWPPISEETKEAVLKELDNAEISIYNRSGIIEEFEDNWSEFHKRKYSLVVNSGTAALHTAMVACNLQAGDEVICPAYTFYATITPLFHVGAIPVLCDAKEDGNIDPDKIEPLITKKTKAILITDMWGIPCEAERIKTICNKHKLLLIEDCSHSHGGIYKNKPIGSYADIVAYSLQGQKIITGGEGGILSTDNKDFYDRANLFGQYNKRCLQEVSKDNPLYRYCVTGFGLKLRAHPFAIAMANQQFRHLPEWHRAKMSNASYLSHALANIPNIRTPKWDQLDEPAWYAYVIQVDESKLSINTKDFCKKLIEKGILDADIPGSTCPVNLLPLFQSPEAIFPAYKGKVAYKAGDFPVAESFYSHAIKFPIDIRSDKKYLAVLDSYGEIILNTIKEFSL